MKKVLASTFLISALALAGCGDKRLDASSSETLSSSADAIQESMGLERGIVFQRAMEYLKDEMSNDSFRVKLNEKTGEEIISMALAKEQENRDEKIAKQEERVTYLKSMIAKRQAINAILDGIEIVDYYEIYDTEQDIPSKNHNRGFVLTVRNNTDKVIYGFQLSGKLYYDLKEPFVQIEMRDKVKYLPGKYEYMLHPMGKALMIDEGLAPGEEYQLKKPMSEPIDALFVTHNSPFLIDDEATDTSKLGAWTFTAKKDDEFIEYRRDFSEHSPVLQSKIERIQEVIEEIKSDPSEILAAS